MAAQETLLRYRNDALGGGGCRLVAGPEGRISVTQRQTWRILVDACQREVLLRRPG